MHSTVSQHGLWMEQKADLGVINPSICCVALENLFNLCFPTSKISIMNKS